MIFNNKVMNFSFITWSPTFSHFTLSLCLSFRVGHTPACRMPIQNLAKVFGPTIVGFSHPEPEAKDILHETKLQSMVSDVIKFLTIEKLGFPAKKKLFFTDSYFGD